MSSFTVLMLCVQACLIQTVLSQCVGPLGYAPPLGAPALSPWASPAPYWGGYGAGCGGYGGSGSGNVAVAGELPVGGATALAGQVPIVGAVEFAGAVPAAGTVTVAGTCACGCQGPYY